MQVDSKKEKNALIVTFHEPRLDSALALQFQPLISTWLDEGYTIVILNLSEVDFIDSTFLGILIQWLKILRLKKPRNNQENRQGDLALCGLGFKVTSLLKLTRMDRVFTIFSDLEHAVQTVTSSRV